MRIKKKAGNWTCSHVTLGRSLGYGTYILTVRDTSHLEPAAVLTMLTFDQQGGDQHYRELDIETSRWGDATDKTNAQFAVQPFYVPGNVARFAAPVGPLTHSLHWESGRASFKTVRGLSLTAGAPLVFEHSFTTGVPTPGTEAVLLMFYVVASAKSPMKNDAEVVLEKFEYLP